MKITKRVISLLLIFTMAISLCSCSKKEPDTYEVSVSKTDNQKEFEGYATSIINEYILIRVEIAKLIESENLASDKEGLQNTILSLKDRCDKLELALDSLINTCDLITNESGTASILDNTKMSLNSVAYAAESSTRVKEWAKEIVDAFDKYPQGKQIKGLAAYLKTDMQTAKKQFDLANDILKNEYENDEQFAQDIIDSLQVIQTTTKVQLCICGAALGNPESLAETGAILLNGVDTVIGFYSTGAEIMLGEDDKVTVTLNKAKDFIAPVSSITGLLTLSGAKTHEALDYIGNSVVDLMYDGKIMGGTVHIDKKEEKIYKIIDKLCFGKNKDADSKSCVHPVVLSALTIYANNQLRKMQKKYLLNLEKRVNEYLHKEYKITPDFYNALQITNIVYNEKTRF